MTILKCFVIFFTGSLLFNGYFCQDYRGRDGDDFSADFDVYRHETTTVGHRSEVERAPSDAVHDDGLIPDQQRETSEESDLTEQKQAEQLREEQEHRKSEQVQLKVQQMHDNFLKRRTLHNLAKSEPSHNGIHMENAFEQNVESVEKLSVDHSAHPSAIVGDQLPLNSKPEYEFGIKFDGRPKYSSSDGRRILLQDMSHAGGEDGMLLERLTNKFEVDSVEDETHRLDRDSVFQLGVKESHSKVEPSPDIKRSDGDVGDVKLNHGINQNLPKDSRQLLPSGGFLSKEIVAEQRQIKTDMLKDEAVAQPSLRLLSDVETVPPNTHSSIERRERGVGTSYQKTHTLRQEFQDDDDDDEDVDENDFNEEEEEDEEGEDEGEEDDEFEDADGEEDVEVYDIDKHDSSKLMSDVKPSHSDIVLATGGASQIVSETSHQAFSNDRRVEVHDSNGGAVRASLEALHSLNTAHQAHRTASDVHKKKLRDYSDSAHASTDVSGDSLEADGDQPNAYHSAAESELHEIPPDNLEFILTASGRRVDSLQEDNEAFLKVDGLSSHRGERRNLGHELDGVFDSDVVDDNIDLYDDSEVVISSSNVDNIDSQAVGTVFVSGSEGAELDVLDDRTDNVLRVTDGFVSDGSSSSINHLSAVRATRYKNYRGGDYVPNSNSPLQPDVLDGAHHPSSPDGEEIAEPTGGKSSQEYHDIPLADSSRKIEHLAVSATQEHSGRATSTRSYHPSSPDVEEITGPTGGKSSEEFHDVPLADSSREIEHLAVSATQEHSGGTISTGSYVENLVNNQVKAAMHHDNGEYSRRELRSNPGGGADDSQVESISDVRPKVDYHDDYRVLTNHGTDDEDDDHDKIATVTSLGDVENRSEDQQSSVGIAAAHDGDNSHIVDRNANFANSRYSGENSETNKILDNEHHPMNGGRAFAGEDFSLSSKNQATSDSDPSNEPYQKPLQSDENNTANNNDDGDPELGLERYDSGESDGNVVSDDLELPRLKTLSSNEPVDEAEPQYSLYDSVLENITESDEAMDSSEGVLGSSDSQEQHFHASDLSFDALTSSETFELEQMENGDGSYETHRQREINDQIYTVAADVDHEDEGDKYDEMEVASNTQDRQYEALDIVDAGGADVWNSLENVNHARELNLDDNVSDEGSVMSDIDAREASKSVENNEEHDKDLTFESIESSIESSAAIDQQSADGAVEPVVEGNGDEAFESNEPPVITDSDSSIDEPSSSDHSWNVFNVLYGTIDLLIIPMEMLMEKLLPQSLYGIFVSAPYGLRPGYVVCLCMAVLFMIFACISMACKCALKKSSGGRGNKRMVSKESFLALQKEKDIDLQELNKLRSKVHESEAQMQKSKSQISHLTSELHITKVERDSLQKTVATHQSQINDLTKQTTDQTLSIAQYAQANQQLQDNLQQMTTHASALETHCYEMQAYMQQVQASQVEYDSQIQCLTAELTVLQTTKDETLLEAERLKECIADLSKEVDRLKEEQHLKEQKIETYDIELNKLRSSFSELKLFELELTDITALDAVVSNHVGSISTGDVGVNLDRVVDGGENVTKNSRTKLVEKLLKCFGDVGQLTAKLNKIEEERTSLQRALTSELELRMQHEDRAQTLAEQLENESTARRLAEQNLKQAAFKMDVLSNFYGENRSEVIPSQLIDDEKTGVKSATDVFREQLDEMQKEKQKLEVEFKKQIAVEEKKAHELWLAARQSEREASQYKSEAQFLRDKVAELQSKLDNAVPDRKLGSEANKSPLTVDDRPNSSGTGGLASENPPRFMPFSPLPNFGSYGHMPRPFLPPFGPPPPHMLPPHMPLLRRPPSELSRDTFDRYSDPYRAHSPFYRERSPSRREQPPSRRRSPTSPTNDSMHSSNSTGALSSLSDASKRPIYGRNDFNPPLSSTLDRSSDSLQPHSSSPAFRDPPRDADYRPVFREPPRNSEYRSGTRGPPR